MAVSLTAVAAAQPSFQGLGDLAGGPLDSSADAVSADGNVVVGFGSTATGSQAFRWTSAGGMVGLGTLGGFGESGAMGVSADGSVVVGYSDSVNGTQAFRWTGAGMVGLGDIPGGAFGSAAGAVTLDGKTVAGIGDLNFNDGTSQAFLWTAANGISGLGDLSGGVFSSTATSISSDAAIIGGTGDFVLGSQGQAFRRYRNGSIVGLGDLWGGAFHSVANSVSNDGSVVVGLANSINGPVAFRAVGSKMTGLGDFPGGAVASEAKGCSADGSVVVGYGTDGAGRKAFIWTSGGSMVSLRDKLIALGVSGLAGWTLESANACSADGTVIVGEGLDPGGNNQAWIARLAGPCNTGTARASVGSPNDAQAAADSAQGSISQNGSLVAFESAAPNLVAGDTNARKDIFVRNRAAGWTTRVSLTQGGFQSNGDSWGARINAKDGRYVVFVSTASNLVTGDTNGKPDIFRRDRISNTTVRVSVDKNGGPANGASDAPQISGDGRFIAFQSTASDLTGDGASPFSFSRIFIRDMQTGTTEQVSVSTNGTPANNACGTPSLSNDGRYIAFTSDANNLSLPPDGDFDTNLARDIFVRDRTLHKTFRASVASDGAQSNGASVLPRISGTGRFIAFTSSATNLVAGDTNARDDVFVRDIFNGSTVRASIGPNQIQPNASCVLAAVSASGRFILFNSAANNLVPHDTNNAVDAFVYDAWTTRTVRASIGNADEQAGAGSTGTALTADGRTAVFHSAAGNLVTGDAGFVDVFARDLCKP
jgi:probable HAF family extracellular repeat protein